MRMIKMFPALLLFLLVVSVPVSASDPFAVGAKLSEPVKIELSELTMEQLLTKARVDDVAACYELGYRFYKGKEATQDYKTASIWFRKAADLGDPAAQTTLGVMYYMGEGIEQDFDQAMKWFGKAADKKFARAQYNIGLMYLNGSGVEKNDDKAVIWFNKAANNNDGQAQYILSCLYLVAQGVNEDYLSAYKWLLLAEYNNVDVSFIKDMVEKSLSDYEKRMATKEASDFIDELKKANDDSGADVSGAISVEPVRGGTGFFISKDGYILTAYHIIRDSKDVRIRSQLGIVPAELVMYDSTNDFALLKIAGYINCKPLPLAAITDKVSLSSPVWTYGYKYGKKVGDSPEFVNGNITALNGLSTSPGLPQKYEILGVVDKQVEAEAKQTPNVRYFQMECDAGPGNAGGAVVGSEGDVIGIFASEFAADKKQIESNKWPVQKHYAVKIAFVLPFIESESGLEVKIAEVRKDRKLEQAAIQAKNATVQVLCY